MSARGSKASSIDLVRRQQTSFVKKRNRKMGKIKEKMSSFLRSSRFICLRLFANVMYFRELVE